MINTVNSKTTIMKFIFSLLVLLISLNSFSQKKNDNTYLKIFADNACECIDSLDVDILSRKQIVDSIHRCISNQVTPYQLAKKLMGIVDEPKDKKKKDKKEKTVINLNINEESEEFKDHYYEIERYLVDSCPAVKAHLAANNDLRENSVSRDPKALEYYQKGLEAGKNEDHKAAIEFYKQAVKIDPRFAFAWDNMGISYRRLGDYDKAIEAYEKSLEIDPEGHMPLQNIAVTYQYKKEYQKAVLAYERLAKIDKDNPEVYYGLGNLYANLMQEYEKGLDNIAKAYRIYVANKSPYRTDAEKIMSIIYGEMKKQGKEKEFYKILEDNNIKAQ
jgi:tetratricopeptide (TPR) repeat protein